MAKLNGEHFLLYTTEQGGQFHVTKCTPEQYETIKEMREVRVEFWNEETIVEPVLVALLAVVEDNHDYIIGGSRDAE